MQSSASSISSAGGSSILNDGFSSDLIRGPVGSFAEDSPIRDRDSPNASYRAAYAMGFSPPYDGSDQQHLYARNRTQDLAKATECLFAKRSEPLNDSNASFGEGLKLLPSSKTVTTDWNELFERYDESHVPSPAVINRSSTLSPSKVNTAVSKNLSMQDVFRSPPVHDLKKRHQLLSSPSFSFGGIDTPGANSNGFSPVNEYPSDDDDCIDARKFNRLRFHSSFDDDNITTVDDQLAFIPPFPPPSISAIPIDELEGVRRSPLQSSDRKSSSVMKPQASVLDNENKSTQGKKSVTPLSKSSRKRTPKKTDINPRTPWTDGDVNTGSIRRVTMGELQSSRSLADINSMMRRDQPIVKSSIKTPSKPKTPVPKKSPPEPLDSATTQATSPMLSDIAPPSAQSKETAAKHFVQEQRKVIGKETEKSIKTEVGKTKEVSKEYSYVYRHHSAVPQHYGAYPTPSVPPFHHEYHSRNVVPPVQYQPHQPPQQANLGMHYAQHPSSSPHIPPRYLERRTTSPSLPLGYALPATPRFQNGFGVRTQHGTNTMYSATHTRISGQPPPYGWPISSSTAPSRFTSPSLHHSAPSSSRPTPGRPMNVDKENENNRSAAAPVKSKRNPCNCKKSRCLKLYCECFSAQIFCDGCNCVDCYNTEGHVEIREKAMKELLHKNKTAFNVKTPGTLAIGCKCKRSECLKKYCECFQAGIVCVDQCKCVSCANRAGSQKLIDKRRKMKDTKGAEYAMQISKEVWEQQPRITSISKPPLLTSREATISRPVVPHRTDAPGKSLLMHSTRPVLLGPPAMGNVGFSPMDNSSRQGDRTTLTENDVDNKKDLTQPIATPTEPMVSTATSTLQSNVKFIELIPANAVAVTDSVNKSGTTIAHAGTPVGVRRLSFDSTTTVSVKKKQKQCIDSTAALHFFGPDVPTLPPYAMATIFQFLPGSDALHTSRVCAAWKSYQNQWGTTNIKQEQ